MGGNFNRSLLPARTSVLALLADVAAPDSSHAACYGRYHLTNNGAQSCVTVGNISFEGNVSNVGTVSPGDFSLSNATISCSNPLNFRRKSLWPTSS
jgi:hypothetical protein